MAKTNKYKKFVEKSEEINIDDIINKARKFFGRPINEKRIDEFSIELHGEAGIKQNELLEYISNITDKRIKAVYMKDNNVHIEL